MSTESEKEQVILPLLHPAQEVVYNCDSRFIAMMCGRRFGKTELVVSIALEGCVYGHHIAYVTPTYLLGKRIFEKIVSNINGNVFAYNKSELIIRSTTGGSIRFFTWERIENVRGQAFHKIIIDEAALCKDLKDKYDAVLRPTLTDYEGGCVMISTPRGKNDFWRISNNKYKGGDDWKLFVFTSYDNPYINHAEIDAARDQLPEDVFNQEYMSVAQDDIGNPFGFEAIDNCIINEMSDLDPVCYGVDLASRVDYTVIIGLDESGNVCYFHRFKADWHEVKKALDRLNELTPIMVDATGVGMPVVEEAIRSNGYIEAFVFTSNTKQSLMSQLQIAIQCKEIGFTESEISKELRDFEYRYEGNTVKYSAPSGFHDDCVMSLALANSVYRERFMNGNNYYL